jgi:hypothetical protein
MFGKGDICADEEPKYKKRRNVIFVTESGGCLIRDRRMSIGCSQMLFWCH